MENIRNFLRGYFYAAWQIRKRNDKIDFELNQCHIHTRNGGKLIFAINRGIAHVDGNTAFAFKEPENSFFDIVENWTTPEIWSFIKANDFCEHGEARINFYELCWIIKTFGGIDFDKM